MRMGLLLLGGLSVEYLACENGSGPIENVPSISVWRIDMIGEMGLGCGHELVSISSVLVVFVCWPFPSGVRSRLCCAPCFFLMFPRRSSMDSLWSVLLSVGDAGGLGS